MPQCQYASKHTSSHNEQTRVQEVEWVRVTEWSKHRTLTPAQVLVLDDLLLNWCSSCGFSYGNTFLGLLTMQVSDFLLLLGCDWSILS